MQTRTPPDITKQILRLIAKVAPGQAPIYLNVTPDENGKVNECFPNVIARIAKSGGTMLCGWQIWEWPSVLVEAEFHAAWVSPGGALSEITPKQHGEETILFVPSPSLLYEGVARDNVRIPIRDDLLVHHFIRVSEEIVKVMNSGDRAGTYGYVNVPAHEIEPLLNAKAFLGQSLSNGLRDHDQCLCGSGRKYKRCHGRDFPS